MARSILVNGWNIPIRLADFNFVEAARNGEVGTGGFDLDSVNAGVAINSHWDVTARETSAPAPDYLYEGYVGDLSIARGPFAINRDRQYDVNIVDLNTLLIDDLITGSSGNRPEETDIARVNWLLGTSFLFGMGGNVGGGGSTTLEAADFRTQTPLNLLTQAAETSGKLFFVYWDFATEAPMLFYDLATASNFITSSKLSTFLADGSNATTHHPVRDTLVRTLDGGRIYSEILYKYDGGSVTVTNSATASNYRPRKTVIFDNNVKTEAHATRKANKFLNFVSTPDDVITCDVHLTAAQINEFRAGQLMQVKAPHLGLPNFSEYRIVRAERKPRAGSHAPDQEDYTVTLEMSVPRSITFGSRGVPSESLPDEVVDVTPTTPATTETANCIAVAGPYVAVSDTENFGKGTGGIPGYPGSWLSYNTPYTAGDCPVGPGGFSLYHDEEVWYPITAVVDNPRYIGLSVTLGPFSSTGYVGGLLLGIANVHPTAENFHNWHLVSSMTVGESRTYVIPRNLINWNGPNSIVLAPNWQCDRPGIFICTSSFGGPVAVGEANSGRYTGHGAFIGDICTVNFVSATTGLSDWVAGYGVTNGTNTVFTLIDWDGTGVPEINYNGVELPDGSATFDSSAKTASLSFAPPPGSTLLFNYSVEAP